ncbi:MAG: hypothetical protein JXJ20_08755 [Anaerolineae bacterium]|nr:hypothetical protein [Anaerolineae bacterium]
MSDDDIRRDDTGEAANSAPKDKFMETLKDLPRLRSIENVENGKSYAPPPPGVARMAGATQGCGGVLVTLISVPMLMVALGFGYYMWGPILLLLGGLLLVAAGVGLWRGGRISVLVGLVMSLTFFAVSYTWRYFVISVAILSPLGIISDMIYGLGLAIGLISLVTGLIFLVLTLLRWRRLKKPTTPVAVAWGIAAVLTIIAPIVVQSTEQDQRKTWLDDRLEGWSADAATDTLVMGGNVGVSLGYSFDVTDPDHEFDVRVAELEAALEAGAFPIRLAANGDILLQQQEELRKAAEDDASITELSDIELSEGLQKQIGYETRYMDRVFEAGVPLFLSDSQYSPHLLELTDNGKDLHPWEAFTVLHLDRVRSYAEQYQPAYYAVVAEPGAYYQYSGIERPADEDDDEANAEAWIEHTGDLIDVVKEVSPDTRIAVTISINDDLDIIYYRAMLEMDGIDLITVDVYQFGSFSQLQDLIDSEGHPRDYDKELWISETWYGFCMAPQRSMALDAQWLEVVVAFAAKEGITGVMPNSFGCFLSPGGTLFIPEPDLSGRTEAWETWRELVETWQGPGPDEVDAGPVEAGDES